MLQLVIEAELLDIEIDHPTDDGVSAMMLAANLGNLGSVRLLLAAGAALNRQSNDGTTALMLAVQNNVSVWSVYECVRDHDGVFDVLMKLGADASLKDVHGRMASDFAANRGNNSRAAQLEKRASFQASESLRKSKRGPAAATFHGRKNRAMAFGADMTKEEEVEKAALEAEAIAAKLLASEEEAATATKSKRQKQKAKQKKRQDQKAKLVDSSSSAAVDQVDHDAMLEETAAVMARHAEVDRQQAGSPEVDFLDLDDDAHAHEVEKRSAKQGSDKTLINDEPSADSSQRRESFSPIFEHVSADAKEPSARELALLSQLDELRRAHDASMEKERLDHRTERDALDASIEKERLDHRIERDALEQQCAVLAHQNDRLIKQRDAATAESESERARARNLEATCDRAFVELKRQASQTVAQTIAQLPDWRSFASGDSESGH